VITDKELNQSLKLGEHFICELSDCNRALLYESERARDIFTRAIRKIGLSIVDEGFYQFSPHGFTCYLLLEESHASLHSWPEHGYCAIDLFTCNLTLDVVPLFDDLKILFEAGHSSVVKVPRYAFVEPLYRPDRQIQGSN
jgi:S-adenosylmethionine decarboxylase proenzyme